MQMQKTTTQSDGLPAAMEAIRLLVTRTVGDLHAAQDDVAAVLGQPAVDRADDAPLGETLPEMLGAVQAEVAETVAAFAQLAECVRAWTHAPAPTLNRATRDEAAAALRRAEEADAWAAPDLATEAALRPYADPVPVPQVAPTLAGLPARTIAEQATLGQEAAVNASVAETEAAEWGQACKTGEALAATLAARDDADRSPTDDAEANADKEGELDLATPVNRIATHLGNGHVAPGGELAAVGVESPEAGKRGGRRRKPGGK